MKITLIAVGQLKPSPHKDLLEEYLKRIPDSLRIKEIDDRKIALHPHRKEQEATLILEHIPKEAFVIALDERGKSLTSLALADLLSKKAQEQEIFFIIGGADGLGQEIRNRANFLLSFGAMTWPHMLVRVLLAEQIYRIYSILSGHPYHRE